MLDWSDIAEPILDVIVLRRPVLAAAIAVLLIAAGIGLWLLL